MDLFDNKNTRINILPTDGEVIYYGKILTNDEASAHFGQLMQNIAWKHDEVVIFGKRIVTKRKVAWYGEKNFSYTYSGTTRQALEWTTGLLELKKLAEEYTGVAYNSCLLNLYHSGEEGMGWHADDEKTLAGESSIASLSFGAVRKFSIRHKTSGDTKSLLLENGSLLEMKGTTQKNWLHALPKALKVKGARINLTFRSMART